MTIHHSENMVQKSDYQLRWITANKPTYSENQIQAALEELKRREMIETNAGNIQTILMKLRDFILSFFK
ncbi:MAG: hypothetical protein JKY33_10410 [Bacteroidia bacterium]|nr:hypothetical protein [Bacteroidia bacterium]